MPYLIWNLGLLLLAASIDAVGGARLTVDRQLQATATVGLVENLRLINADTDLPILNLTNNLAINVYSLNASNFSIQATKTASSDAVIGSIRFAYNGNIRFRTDSVAPFSMCPTAGGRDYQTCTVLGIGVHNVTATPFSGVNASGAIGIPFHVSFQIINVPPTSSPNAAPSIAPSEAPTAIPTKSPNLSPTILPTNSPITSPTTLPSTAPTFEPTTLPSMFPSSLPTTLPTKGPTSPPVSSCRVPQFLDASWQNFPPKYPLKNGEPQGLLVGNDLVIFGGFTNSFTIATNRTYARDVTGAISSEWRRMDDMPLLSGITHAATVAVGQKVYFCGGYQGAHPGPHVPYCFVYDHSKAPGTGQWSNFTFLPNGGTAGAGMIYDSLQNMLYYTGGGQRLIPNSIHPIDVNDTWKISLSNPNAGWVASTPIPYHANHLSYVTHRDDQGAERHFFLGGQMQEYESNGNLADNYEFVTANETWIRRADMPFPRGHVAASTRAIGCGFIIAGGSANSGSTKKNRIADVSYYDIPSDTWTAGIGMLPLAGATPVVVIHPNGYMHFVNAAPSSSRRRIAA